MATTTQGDVSVDIIGGFPKSTQSATDSKAPQRSAIQDEGDTTQIRIATSDFQEPDSTVWSIQPPANTVQQSPGRSSSYTFGSNMGAFIYTQPPQTAFGTEGGSRKGASTWPSPTKTPRQANPGAFRTPQRTREMPPHLQETSGTPSGLNQTGIPFDPSRTLPVTSTAAPVKGREVVRLPQNTRKMSQTKAVGYKNGQVQELQVEQVPVTGLTDIEGPLTGVLQDARCYTEVFVEFFACMDTAELQDYPIYARELVQRREEALQKGRTFLQQRRFTNSNIDGNNQLKPSERFEFEETLDKLDNVLTGIDRYEDDYFIGYKLEKEKFRDLNKDLLELRATTRDEMISSGVGIQDLPCWGLDGNINDFWEGNDFEILATCYRHEVVQYLTTIYRTSQELASKETDVLQKGPEDQKPVTVNPMFANAPTPIATRIQNFTNQNASIFGNPSKHTSSRKLADMLTSNRTMTFDQTIEGDNLKNVNTGKDGYKKDNTNTGGGGTNPRRVPGGGGGYSGNKGGSGGPGGGGGSGGSGGSGGGGGSGGSGGSGGNGGGSGPPNGNPTIGAAGGRPPVIPQFDNKLKVDMIPGWDGNPDDLGRWILKVNRLSERSTVVFNQLGYLVPTRLTGAAESWYYSQSAETRARIEASWGTLRAAIAAYYMNRSYLEKQRIRANKARYREPGYQGETPSEYFIRKLDLLEIVYNYSEGELINEIMAGAPTYWSTVLTPHLYDNLENFQMAVKFQEDNLLRMGYDAYRVRQEYGSTFRQESNRNPFASYKRQAEVKVNAAGVNLTPMFPKDDDNVSARGTPISKGGRPCRHCGSGNHWDPECKYARKGEKRARVNAASSTMEEIQAQQEYEDLYYSTISDDSDEEDFQ